MYNNYKEIYKQTYQSKNPKSQIRRKKPWKTANEKWLATYTGTLARLKAEFSSETTEARREWDNIFKVFKEK